MFNLGRLLGGEVGEVGVAVRSGSLRFRVDWRRRRFQPVCRGRGGERKEILVAIVIVSFWLWEEGSMLERARMVGFGV
jgi:hypothetical protein